MVTHVGMTIILMPAEMIISLKRLATIRLITDEGTLPSVLADMLFKTAWTVKDFITAIVAALVNLWPSLETDVVVIRCF